MLGYFIGLFRFASAVLAILLFINLYDFEAGFSLQGFIDFMYAFYQTLLDNINIAINKFFPGNTASPVNPINPIDKLPPYYKSVDFNDKYHEGIASMRSYIVNRAINNHVNTVVDQATSSSDWLFWTGLIILGCLLVGVIVTDNPIKTEIKNTFDSNQPSIIRDYVYNPVKSFIRKLFTLDEPGTPGAGSAGIRVPDSVDSHVSHPVSPDQDFKANFFKRFYNAIFRRDSSNLPVYQMSLLIILTPYLVVSIVL